MEAGRFLIVALLAVALLLASAVHAAAAPRDMHFAHYTYALIWEPGACLTHDELAGPHCATLKPAAVASRQWSLHGLWPSTPRGLAQAGMPDPTWWRYGCYWYGPDHAIPASSCSNPPLDLAPALRTRLDAAMPAAASCLDRHEFFKHAACYGFEANAFFRRALDLTATVNANPFTAFVRAHRGQTVSRTALLAAFRRGFELDSSAALELRCDRAPGVAREEVLVQAWLTIRADRIDRFPAPASFAAGRRGNCPARIVIAR